LICNKGILAERFGAKWIFGGSILISGILTLLTPLAARLHVGLLIAIRLLIGAFEVSLYD
jgi:nitrate/nitrite transporter NarK